MRTQLLFPTILFFFLSFAPIYTFSKAFSSTPQTQLATWSGLVSTNWNTAGNWIGNIVPGPTDDVTIPVGCPHYPVLSQGTSQGCNNMIVAGSGNKNNPLSGGLTISGELTVTGNFTVTLTGVVNITAGGNLTTDGDMTITGSLHVETQGSLITNGIVTGTATIDRVINPDLGWHFLSSPVVNQEICNGIFAPTIASFPGNPTGWDFYKWVSDSITPATHWRSLRTYTGAINYADFGNPPYFEIAQGYFVAYSNDFPTTKSFVGNPNTGDVVCSFHDIPPECTWALLGNPFPSAIDWDQFTGKDSNLVSQYYYVYNEYKAGGQGYEYWKDSDHYSSPDITGKIPSMQGFFVCPVPAVVASIGIPNSSRTHDNGIDYWLKSTQENKLSIIFSNGTHYDKAFLLFENNGSLGIDVNDAVKLFTMASDIPQVYTTIDNDMKSCFNSLPYFTDGITIPVGIIVQETGVYSLNFSGIESFISLSGLLLEDLLLNCTQDLLQNPVYVFSAEGFEDHNRFLLPFEGPVGIGEKRNSINISSYDKNLVITCPSGFHNAQVTVSNLLGQQIFSKKLNNQFLNNFELDVMSGYYIVRVRDDELVKTVKVYIQ